MLKSRQRITLLALLSTTFAAPWPAAAQQVRSGLSSVDLFALGDQATAEGRIDDATAIYDALTGDPDREVRAEARFRKGMMLADAKHYADAAVTFRALLDEKPDAVRVRLELARVLALLGDEDGARRALRQAQAAGLPPDVALVVDQFVSALRSRKQLGGSIEIALAPDSNINRATDARTLDTVIAPLTLSDDARARSGFGLKLSGQGYARLPISDSLSVLPRLSGRGDIYRHGDFNDISGSALVGLEWHRRKERLTPSLGQTWRWYGGDLYATTQTASLEWLRTAGTRAQFDTSLSASRARYRSNPLQDGAIYDVSVGYERAFDAKSGASINLGVTRQTARDPGYATVSGGVSSLAWREIGRTTLFASVGARRLEGDERLLLFPDRRREWLYQSSLGGQFRQLTIGGFSPVLRARFERNRSTVGIYDYRRIALEAGITRAF